MLLYRRIDAGQDIPVHSPGAATYQDTLTDTRTSIGEMYEKGLGVPQDYKAARYWYQKAIDTGGAGLSGPSGRLARLYEQGLGGPRDHQKYLQLDPVQVVKEQEAEERRKNEALMSGLAAVAAARHGPSSYQQCKDRCWDEAKLCNAGSFVGGKAFPTPSNLSFTCSLPYSLCTAGCR
jgi:TPR repeat protein